MNRNYPRDTYFLKIEKEKSPLENWKNNVWGILAKMPFTNELKIRYGERFVDSANMIISKLMESGGWVRGETRRIEDAKDIDGKKMNIIVIETIIRRHDSLWKKFKDG